MTDLRDGTDDAGDDPFDGLVLDDDFIRGANKAEASAEQRHAAAARARAAHAQLTSQRKAEAAAPRRAKRRQRLRVVAFLGTIVLITGGLTWWLKAHPSVKGAIGDAVIRSPQPLERPPAQPASSDTPLGRPAPTGGADGAHAFLDTGPNGEPTAYDPCRPIPVVVNTRTAPAGGAVALDQAIAEVSRLTGLQFVREGSTDEAPSVERQAYQPERYGRRWAPVLIAWSDPAETPRLAVDTAGIGGSTPILVDDHHTYVTGQIVLDGPDLAAALAQSNGTALARAIIQHELGHLVGLDHVKDDRELMFDDNVGLTAFGAGDRAGLARLGAGPCEARL